MRVLRLLTCMLAMALASTAYATPATKSGADVATAPHQMFHVEHAAMPSAPAPLHDGSLDPLLPMSIAIRFQDAATQERPAVHPAVSMVMGKPEHQANHGMLKVAWRS